MTSTSRKEIIEKIRKHNITACQGFATDIELLKYHPGYNPQDESSILYNEAQQTSKRTLNTSQIGQGGLFE